MSDAGSEVVGLGTILILEDEVLVSIVMEDLLRDMGASEVLVATDAAGALAMLRTSPPDFAILDVHLGFGVTSLEVADALDAQGISFMFSSALGDVAVEPRHKHRPMLGKPFADEELRACVMGLVKR